MCSTLIKFAVAVFVFTSRPRPAVIRLNDAFPKLVGVRSRALSTAPLSRGRSILRYLKVFAARFAGNPHTKLAALIGTVKTGSIPRPRMKRFLASLTTACYFQSSHDVNLRDRFALRIGSLAAQTACGPLVFYHEGATLC